MNKSKILKPLFIIVSILLDSILEQPVRISKIAPSRNSFFINPPTIHNYKQKY